VPTDAATGPDRRNRILDAAERVFSEEGYHGTTLREVAKATDVRLSLITYHFESKLVLYTAIFARRQHLNDGRIRRLEAMAGARNTALGDCFVVEGIT